MFILKTSTIFEDSALIRRTRKKVLEEEVSEEVETIVEHYFIAVEFRPCWPDLLEVSERVREEVG